jgi:hypothetical protein
MYVSDGVNVRGNVSFKFIGAFSAKIVNFVTHKNNQISKWNKCNIYVGDQMDCWNELKEVLRVQTRAEVAQILLEQWSLLNVF